jgi:hypothetical protein
MYVLCMCVCICVYM